MDPEKIAVIMAMRPRETKTEVKSFPGMVNYLQQFLLKFISSGQGTSKFREEGVHFAWDAEHQSFLENIKALLGV